jgi:hypothetical protein
LADANAAVRLARIFLARRRQHMSTAKKMNAHPRAISKISHHSRGRRLDVLMGVFRPDGNGVPGLVPEGAGTMTNSERQTPKPVTTLEELLQLAATQLPPRSTWLELEHARQLVGPDPEQLEQLVSHDWHVDDVLSKNCDLLHVGRHRPFVKTGRFGGQLEHWLKEDPEQVAQSGWQLVQMPDELKALDGHEDTHLPLEAS